jgi:hypothetical protein
MVNDTFSSVLDRPQAEIRLVSLAGFQAIKLYEDQQIHHCVPPRDLSHFIAHSGTSFAQDLYAQAQPHADTLPLREGLADLHRHYAVVTDESLITDVLVMVPALYYLLKEAVQPLRCAFGERKLLQLEALESDEDTVLRVMVKLPSDTPRPAELMHKFKRDWWLTNCSRSQALLVFDYEIGNGF